MTKWIALGLGLTSVAVTATTVITNRKKIKNELWPISNFIKLRKGEWVPETTEVTKTPVSKRSYWLPFTSGPAFTSNEDIGWVNG